MLQLQRASAGSGKTYTLAKKFIYFLITIKDHERGTVRMRTDAEIADGVSRILAITFTNKATAEMKLRIVEKLAALAATENKEITPKLLKDTAYLKDFSEELNITYKQVAHYAKTALTALLNQYSDFHVSTIDSFFQSVLRTFAYESNLNDSYQVEIDSDYISSAAVDATLDEVNTAVRQGSHSSFWIDLLMNDASEETGKVWNVFQKNTSDDTIYSKLLMALKRMDNEEFKEKRGKLDEYLATEEGASRLINAYQKLRGDIESMLMAPFAQMVTAKEEFERLLAANGLAKEDLGQYVEGHLEKIGNFKFDRQEAKDKWFSAKDLSGKKSVLKKGVKCGSEPELKAKAKEMYASYEEWKSLFESERYRLWNIYSATLPYLGLLLEAREKINAFLESNNLIQIGETNSMLMRIIGDSDTPFIYERLGTQLNHYLIDEFQDTSKMQWGNLNKLLRESESRGEDNLIIGDAKQSIYRFRNAEPSLITTGVAHEFAKSVEVCGMSKEENTNWRSWRRIVEFNNYFFQALAKEVGKIQEATYSGTKPESYPDKVDFGNLYSNVVQYPNKQEDQGYVEIRFFEAPAKEDKKDDERDPEQTAALKEVGPLISSLIARGYRQKDIALLIDTKKLGNAVVDAIIEYNSTLDNDTPRIEFISEDSLVVSSSEAVGTIVSTLKKIAEGKDRQEGKDGQEGKDDFQKVNWNDIKSDFAYFALQHPELTPSEQISAFLKIGKPIDAIREMMHGMQAVTLPSLVESIVENFVTEDLRKSQALYIAGFQDLVLDYCERYAADIASFLGWWESRAKFLSITSPEDTDAVRIMTIHKSKGLEFKCVILPYEAKGITPSNKKTEWRWVDPSPIFKDYDLPEWLPIETTKKLLDTEYADIYRKYSDLYMMDKLNSLYVAFTRAKCELYIFSKYMKPESKSRTSIAWFLKEICSNMEEYLPEDMTDIIPPALQTADEDGMRITFGSKIDPKPEEESIKRNENDEDRTFQESKIVEDYRVNSCPKILHCRENESPDSKMRSEGTLLHTIMESVTTAGDLRKSILSMKMRGAITSQQAQEWEEMLAEAISEERVKGWYDGSWRVMNERRILQSDKMTHRPDRIMLSRDGKTAVIVDYKFGEDPEDEATDETFENYQDQLRGYTNALKKATEIKDVTAYLWYVRSGRLYKIDRKSYQVVE